MKFKVGQTVEVVSNHGIVAEIGATAIVTKSNYNYTIGIELIGVVWKTNYNNQMNGRYYIHYFKPVPQKNEQLVFSFME